MSKFRRTFLTWKVLGPIGAFFLMIITVLWLAPRILESKFIFPGIPDVTADEGTKGELMGKLGDELKTAQKKWDKMAPSGSYIIINTTENRFMLYDKNGLVREGLCSTGSYIKLEKDDKKAWLFHTPKGVRKVLGKKKDPVWKKPDWAFIEEGLPVPPANDPSRYEYGSLGDYALTLGDGYMIHGTLYQRFLGQAVTHGCVRLNDEDLEVVFNTLSIGSKVYIY